jgi:hypothetical protein
MITFSVSTDAVYWKWGGQLPAAPTYKEAFKRQLNNQKYVSSKPKFAHAKEF